MTTISDLITYLQTLPQDLIVQCLKEEQRGYDTWTTWEDLEIEEHIAIVGKWIEIGEK